MLRGSKCHELNNKTEEGGYRAMLHKMIRENLSDKVIFERIFEDGEGSCAESRAEHGIMDARQIYMGGVE